MSELIGLLFFSVGLNIWQFIQTGRMHRAGFNLMCQYEDTWVRYQKMTRIRTPDWQLRREFRDRMLSQGRP